MCPRKQGTKVQDYTPPHNVESREGLIQIVGGDVRTILTCLLAGGSK